MRLILLLTFSCFLKASCVVAYEEDIEMIIECRDELNLDTATIMDSSQYGKNNFKDLPCFVQCLLIKMGFLRNDGSLDVALIEATHIATQKLCHEMRICDNAKAHSVIFSCAEKVSHVTTVNCEQALTFYGCTSGQSSVW